jgi:hypothetical protein
LCWDKWADASTARAGQSLAATISTGRKPQSFLPSRIAAGRRRADSFQSPRRQRVADKYTFSAVNSDTVSVNSVSNGGAPCTYKVAPLNPGAVQFTSASIEKQASNGTFAQTGAFEFKYQANAGFKGSDQYAIKVCGHNSQRGGCANITYKITVN